MNRLARLFNEHPASVGESYLQHMAASLSFSVPMLLSSLALLVHGLFPFVFKRTGSDTVTSLYERMVANRERLRRHRG